MTAYLLRLPAGVAGQVNRVVEATIEAGILMATALPITFGTPVTVDATTRQYRGILVGDLGSAVIGFIARPYPTMSAGYGSTSEALGSQLVSANVPSPVINCLKRGYIIAQNNSGAALKGSPVYVRVANPSGLKVVGGVEAVLDATPANTLAIPGAYFTGPADANGVIEIAFNL